MKIVNMVLLAVSLTAAVVPISARADTFAYNFTGPTISGTMIMTASQVLPGTYLITNVTGFTNGLAIASILPPGSYPILMGGLPANDNLLFPLSPTAIFDLAGLSYVLSDGTDFNIYHLGSGYDYAIGATGGGLITMIGPTPEPGGLLLVATGMLGIAGMVRGRKLL